MNYYTVLLLLILTHFSCSMKGIPRRQRMKRENSKKEWETWNQLIPLNLTNDEATNQFLNTHSLGFRKSIIQKIKNKKDAVISLLRQKCDGDGKFNFITDYPFEII